MSRTARFERRCGNSGLGGPGEAQFDWRMTVSLVCDLVPPEHRRQYLPGKGMTPFAGRKHGPGRGVNAPCRPGRQFP